MSSTLAEWFILCQGAGYEIAAALIIVAAVVGMIVIGKVGRAMSPPIQADSPVQNGCGMVVLTVMAMPSLLMLLLAMAAATIDFLY